MRNRLRRYTARNVLNTGNFFNRLSVTIQLIFANIVLFIIGSVIIWTNPNFIDYIALNPSFIIHGKYLWTIITSMFMHANIFHLMINMFVLFSLGSFCEKIIGSRRFFWFYIISGIAAGIVAVIFPVFFGSTSIGGMIFGSPDMPGVGASGAIFAIAGLFVIITPKLRFSIIFLPFFSLPAYIMIPLVLFLTWIVSAGTGLPIGNTAHFGGLIAGIAYGTYLKNKYSRKIQLLNESIQ